MERNLRCCWMVIWEGYYSVSQGVRVSISEEFTGTSSLCFILFTIKINLVYSGGDIIPYCFSSHYINVAVVVEVQPEAHSEQGAEENCFGSEEVQKFGEGCLNTFGVAFGGGNFNALF